LLKHILALGCFDHFHEGHKFYLQKVSELAQKVTVLILSAPYVAKEFQELIEPYEVRRANVERFLEEKGIKAEIYGPIEKPENTKYVLDDPSLDACAFGIKSFNPSIKKKVEAVNEAREKRGLKPLVTVVIPVLRDPEGKIYSATRVRRTICPI